ncbi:MAG: hypothetical protein ACJ790_04640 [Myxococcaceae bacterium]
MRNALSAATLLCLAACSGPTTVRAIDDAPPVALAPAEPANVPYNEALQTSAHNAFEREEPLLDQLDYDRVRSLELDIHDHKAGVDAPPGDWFVYHEDLPANRSTSCNLLSDCARLLTAFHRSFPEHEVVTLWLDLKGNFEGSHDFAALDDEVSRLLGRENIITPSDLIARCPGATDLRSAVTGSCSFPRLSELRGKFIVAVTGGTLCNSSDKVAQYRRGDRLMFLAPGVDSGCPVESYDDKPDVVMFNMVFEQHERAAQVRSKGLVARVYRGLFSFNNSTDFLAAEAVGTNHLAMDMLNILQDPWASTQSPNGFPFACDGCAPPVREPGAVIGVEASTGDLADNRDSFYFASNESTPNGPSETWETMVSVPSSHVEPLAKGCLMARESDAADSAFFAVCRPFDQHPPRALIRAKTGEAVSIVEAATTDGFRPETAAFLKLSINGSDLIASTSIDGTDWRELARATVPVPLLHRGLAVASNGDSVKALFTNVTREGETLSAASFSERGTIGVRAVGHLFDGVNRQ